MKRTLAVLLRVIIILLVIALIILGGRRLVMRKKQMLAAAPKYGEKPVPVHVTKAERGSLGEALTYLAICEPVRVADISARITATIEKINCDEGTVVKKGQTLILLDDREIKEGLAAAESEIERVRADLEGNEALVESLKQSVAYWNREAERDKALAERGDIPGSQAEKTQETANEYNGKLLATEQKSHALQHQIESLNTRKNQLSVQLSYCTIQSPYDGLVTRRFVDPGDLASVAKPLLVIEDRSELKLSFNIPQQDLSKIHEGLPLQFKVQDSERRSELTHLYPSLDSDRTIRAESLLNDESADGITCGSYLPVSVVVNTLTDVVLIPEGALIKDPAGKTHVFVVRGEKLEHPAVTILGRNGDKVAVSGIEAGESVVTSTFLGWANLSGGMKVESVQ